MIAITPAVIGILLTLIIFILANEIYRSKVKQIESLSEEVKALREANDNLRDRVHYLELSNPKRINVKSFRALENAQATNSRLEDLLIDALEFVKSTKFHLSIAHTPDGENGKKTT